MSEPEAPENMSEPEKKKVLHNLCEVRKGVQTKWLKGGLQDQHGNRCLIGHVYHVLPPTPGESLRDPTRVLRTKVLWLLMGEVPSKYLGSIPAFNDDRGTSKEDVLALIDRAAKKVQDE